MKKFECIEHIVKVLKEKFSGIQADSYGYCCPTDYDEYHDYINRDDYVCCKLYKGGDNNNFSNKENKFEIDDFKSVHFMWKFTKFKKEEVLMTMQEVASLYNYKIVEPESEMYCIHLEF